MASFIMNKIEAAATAPQLAAYIPMINDPKANVVHVTTSFLACMHRTALKNFSSDKRMGYSGFAEDLILGSPTFLDEK